MTQQVILEFKSEAGDGIVKAVTSDLDSVVIYVHGARFELSKLLLNYLLPNGLNAPYEE